MNKKKKSITFEDAIDELETTVQQLEKGDLSLDESLTQFKKGIELYKYCHELLSKAEGEIKVILDKDNGQLDEIDFGDDN